MRGPTSTKPVAFASLLWLSWPVGTGLSGGSPNQLPLVLDLDRVSCLPPSLGDGWVTFLCWSHLRAGEGVKWKGYLWHSPELPPEGSAPLVASRKWALPWPTCQWVLSGERWKKTESPLAGAAVRPLSALLRARHHFPGAIRSPIFHGLGRGRPSHRQSVLKGKRPGCQNSGKLDLGFGFVQVSGRPGVPSPGSV